MQKRVVCMSGWKAKSSLTGRSNRYGGLLFHTSYTAVLQMGVLDRKAWGDLVWTLHIDARQRSSFYV